MTATARGLFIGSGIIEAACKTVIWFKAGASGNVLDRSRRLRNSRSPLHHWLGGLFEDHWESLDDSKFYVKHLGIA